MSHIGVAVRPDRGGATLRAGVLAYVAALVVMPLAALIQHGLAGGPAALWQAVASPAAAHALLLTVWTSGVMALINAVMGTATAWALVRYEFPGRGLLSGIVDLPFAIPTLVTGVMLVILFGPQSALGSWLAGMGAKVAFAPPSIVLALLFVTVPFVVRAVEPVLLEQDPTEEEAAHTLGADTFTVFFRVLLPPLIPSILSGTIRSLACALGEFGSVVVVSGNIPYRTLTAPVYVFSASASRSPPSPRCCCWTSSSARWTPRCGKSCATGCGTCTTRSTSLPSSSPTTKRRLSPSPTS